MKLEKIALIGAGAVGAYFIRGLSERKDIRFTVIAEGERKRRLTEKGIRINGVFYFPAVQTAQEAGEQDLVLLATKYGGLREALAMLPLLVGERTLVMSLLNGVDSEEKAAAVVGKKHIVHALMRIGSRRTDEGVAFDPSPEATQGLIYGCVPGWTEAPEEALNALEELFGGTEVNHRSSDCILKEIWFKFAGNVANNLPQAVLGVPSALYFNSEHGRYLAEKLWAEVVAVAAAKGISLTPHAVIFSEVPKNSRYSTLQDLDAGRHTEIEMFAGELIRMAAEFGLQVPYADYTYHAIKALEEKNDGVFDV